MLRRSVFLKKEEGGNAVKHISGGASIL